MSKKLVYLDISGELLLALFQAQGEQILKELVKASKQLPPDAKIIEAEFLPEVDLLHLTIEIPEKEKSPAALAKPSGL